MSDTDTLKQIFEFNAPYNENYIEYLKNDINRTLPLIGAGMSMPFGCFSINDLVRKLAQWFPNKSEVLNIVETAIKKNDIHKAIDTLDGIQYFNGNIQAALEKHFTDNKPDLSANTVRFNSLKKIITRINNLGTLGAQLILTTNYDRVIEGVIDEINKRNKPNIAYDVFSPNNVQKLFDRELSNKLKVLKFHGNCTDKDTLVLTSHSFKANYGITGSLNSMDIRVNYKGNNVCPVLRKMVGSYSILFLGCSLKEDSFIKLFRNLSKYSMYQHYAILPKPENDNDVQELLTQAIRMNTAVIWIKEGNYDWIDAIIEYIFTLSSIPTNLTVKQNTSINEADIIESLNPENDNNIENNEVWKKKIEELFQSKIHVKVVNTAMCVISFPMYKIEGGRYEIYLIAKNDGVYLSDEGSTIMELDKIFELGEPDVMKNLVAIMKQYGCKMVDKKIIIDCSFKDIHVKMSYLIQAISFMLNMKIFYV